MQVHACVCVHACAGLCVYMCTVSGYVYVHLQCVCVHVWVCVCMCVVKEGGGGSALMERSGVWTSSSWL